MERYWQGDVKQREAKQIYNTSVLLFVAGSHRVKSVCKGIILRAQSLH